jgi:hypothetical protein
VGEMKLRVSLVVQRSHFGLRAVAQIELTLAGECGMGKEVNED